MRARYEIHLENYCKVTTIEAKTLLDMVQRGILPAVSRYTDQLAVAVFHKKADSRLPISVKMEEMTLLRLSELSEKLFDTCEALTAALSKAPAADSGIDAARWYRTNISTRTQQAGELISQLEALMPADVWPFPTYADILFSV